MPVVSPLEIWLPISTCFKPTRPSIGAVMRLQFSWSWALATAASSALIVPWVSLTSDCWVSSSWRDTRLVFTNCW